MIVSFFKEIHQVSVAGANHLVDLMPVRAHAKLAPHTRPAATHPP